MIQILKIGGVKLWSMASRTLSKSLPALKRSLATHASTPFFPDEPTGPKIVSKSIPGPNSIKLSQEIALFQDNRTHALVCDYASSKGQFSRHNHYSYVIHSVEFVQIR